MARLSEKAGVSDSFGTHGAALRFRNSGRDRSKRPRRPPGTRHRFRRCRSTTLPAI